MTRHWIDRSPCRKLAPPRFDDLAVSRSATVENMAVDIIPDTRWYWWCEQNIEVGRFLIRLLTIYGYEELNYVTPVDHIDFEGGIKVREPTAQELASIRNGYDILLLNDELRRDLMNYTFEPLAHIVERMKYAMQRRIDEREATRIKPKLTKKELELLSSIANHSLRWGESYSFKAMDGLEYHGLADMEERSGFPRLTPLGRLVAAG